MLFSSISFLYYFLPVVLILYFVVPSKLKNLVLLLASLVFYGWGEPIYILLMLASILIGYVSACLIGAKNNRRFRRFVLAAATLTLLGFLAYFKYADFFLENFNAVTGISVPLLRIALPIGISFYTFQILSYVIDVYRRDVKVQKNIVNLAAYITMFPQLIAGPIVRYRDIANRLESRTHSFANFALGLRRFVMGLSKKVLIANVLGQLCDIFRSSEEKSVLFYWMYVLAFSLQIYFDFSGYSDMAIGLGRIFGFRFCENFNYPFISKSITEFWRRWHMSLSTWFRDYVYIPLGGNRVSRTRWLFNIFVVWMLTGFWHGAAWNFILWGLYFAVFLCIEKLFLLKKLKTHKVIGRVYTLLVVAISFVIFNAADMGELFVDIKSIFGFGNLPFVTKECLYYLRSYALPLLFALFGATPFVKLSAKRLPKAIRNSAEPIVLVVLVLLVTAFLVDGSFNPFLYFRF